MPDIYIAIGANMSNPKETLLALPQKLAGVGINVFTASSLWRNPAWPEGQGYSDYLNGVLSVGFDGSALDLLGILQTIEHEAGRVRTRRNAPRSLDLDIIDFRGETHASQALTLPHPRMHSRAFVLLPFAEIAPDWRHPVTNLSIMTLLGALPLKEMDKMKFESKISYA